MNIMIFNGLLLFLLIMWTSAETVPETETEIETETETETETGRTGGHQVYANKSLVDTQARKGACENLGGKCVKRRKDCPSSQPLETEPGRPFCSRNHRCCYPGPSCSLEWDHDEHRPLIMIRETKTIVPPVDKDTSNDPNRIPLGVKLVFACAGASNAFNHIEGVHTKLHGECVSEDQFKVCLNNSPVYLDLSELSCSKPLFPSFIKKDNGTSDDYGCDELGGELYKQGYTYGDHHEFKDLEIDVCFTEKDEKTLCTIPNLSGNETDYRAEEPIGWDTRMSAEKITPPESECDADPVDPAPIPVPSIDDICHEQNGYTVCVVGSPLAVGRCSAVPISGSQDRGTTPACKSPNMCWVPNVCPNPCFESKHVCDYCEGDGAEDKALAFTIQARGNPPTNPTVFENTVFYIPGNVQERFMLISPKCFMHVKSITFHCTLGQGRMWHECKQRGVCGSDSDLAYIGHLYPDSVTGGNCKKVQ